MFAIRNDHVPPGRAGGTCNTQPFLFHPPPSLPRPPLLHFLPFCKSVSSTGLSFRGATEASLKAWVWVSFSTRTHKETLIMFHVISMSLWYLMRSMSSHLGSKPSCHPSSQELPRISQFLPIPGGDCSVQAAPYGRKSWTRFYSSHLAVMASLTHFTSQLADSRKGSPFCATSRFAVWRVACEVTVRASSVKTQMMLLFRPPQMFCLGTSR